MPLSARAIENKQLLPFGKRRCVKCGRIKEVTGFHRWSASQDGYRPECAGCRGVIRPRAIGHGEKLARLKEENAILAPKGRKRCSLCWEAKLFEAFNRHPATGYQTRCRACAAQLSGRALTSEEEVSLRHALFNQGLRRCRICKKTKTFSEFGAATTLEGACLACKPEWKRVMAADGRRVRRIEMLGKYGGACYCCGEARLEFLALDHKNGGGNKERLKRIYPSGNGMYWWLKKRGWPQDGLRVACHNCNSAVAFHGACAHAPAGNETIWIPCASCTGKRGRDLCDACYTKQRRVWVRQSAQRLRLETFEVYGRRCACCQEARMPFLTLDHAAGGGNRDRYAKFGVKSAAGVRFYRYLRRKGFPPGFRPLCWNCQLANGYYGYCPHLKTQ